LVGSNDHADVLSCRAEATVVGGSQGIGGLVGYAYYGDISYCCSSGSVQGEDEIGGLVGRTFYAFIGKCYSTSNVIGDDEVGGLVGYKNALHVFDSYASGNVLGDSEVGGLVGDNTNGDINRCYSTGVVGGNSDVGGLVGHNGDKVIDSFWDVNSSGQTTSAGGTGKTTTEMKTKSTFTDTGWDFNTPVWKICEGTNYPKLAWQIPLLGDFVCPDGVEMRDFAILAAQWQLERLSEDTFPDGGDGMVNFLDWAVFANGWQDTKDINDLAVFTDQWLQFGAWCADIAPDKGDGVVDWFDLEAQVENWLAGI